MLWIFLILDFSRDYFTFQLLLFSTAIIEGSRTKNKSSGNMPDHSSAWHCICWKDHISVWMLDLKIKLWWLWNFRMEFSGLPLTNLVLFVLFLFERVCFFCFWVFFFWAVCFFFHVLICNNYMDMCLYLLNILILHIWLLEF